MRFIPVVLACFFLLLFSAGGQAQLYNHALTADTQITAVTEYITCIASIICDASTNAATVAIKAGTSTGTTVLTLKDLATDNGQSKVFDFNGGYFWVEGGCYVDLTNSVNCNVFTVIPSGDKLVKLKYVGTASASFRDQWYGRTHTVSTNDIITCSDAFAYSKLTSSSRADWKLYPY